MILILEQSKAFITPTSISSYINIHELEVLPVAFDILAKSWHQYKVIVYNDNITAFNNLTNLMLRSPSNKPLWKLLLLATQNNIVIKLVGSNQQIMA